MSFRTVVIKNRCKLDLCANFMVYRGTEEKRIYIKEISCLIIESTAVSLTASLLSELIKNDVKVIFCDEKHNPESELVPYYGNYHSSKRLLKQLEWGEDIKKELWGKIIAEKIVKQSALLAKIGNKLKSQMVYGYSTQVVGADETNREGHAAKVYFQALFGADFERRIDHDINSALNYGYSILLSCFNREVCASGYLTQLGIWHKNEFNYFNLSSDIMEPFRVLIDEIVYSLTEEQLKNFKMEILKIFEKQLVIKGRKYIFEDSISVYCQSVFDALNSRDVNKVYFYEL